MKRRWFVLGFCLAGFLAAGAPVHGQEKVTLRLKPYPEGQVAHYKQVFYYQYISNRGEMINPQAQTGSSEQVIMDGEFKSQEKAVQAKGDTLEVEATVHDASSSVRLDGMRLTNVNFPYTLDMLNDRPFSMRFLSDGHLVHFSPAFQAYELAREDMVTNLYQRWVPEISPVFPDTPVGEGDSWTKEQTFKMPFSEYPGQQALVELKSTYKVKKIQEHKGRTIVELEEHRVVQYTGWLRVDPISILVKGAGDGDGKWEIDATRGLVLSQESQMDIARPSVMVYGQKQPVDNIRAEVKLSFKRQLEKLSAK